MGDFSCRTGCEVWSMSEVFPRWFDYFLHKNPHRRGSQWLEVWNPCEFFLLLPYSLVWFFLRWPCFQIITIKNLYSIFKSKFTFLWDTKSFLYVRCFSKIWFKGPDCPDEGWRSVKPVSSFFAFYLIRYIHCSDLRLVCKVSCYVVFVDLIERGISSSDQWSFFFFS